MAVNESFTQVSSHPVDVLKERSRQQVDDQVHGNVQQVSSCKSTFDLNSYLSPFQQVVPLLRPVPLPRPATMSETSAPIHFSLSPPPRLASNRLIGFIFPLRPPAPFAPSFSHCLTALAVHLMHTPLLSIDRSSR